MTTPNINLSVVFLCLGTETLSGRNEPPKHDANLTFYVPGLKPRPNHLEITLNSIFGYQYYDNTEYKFIGRSLTSRHPNALRLK